MARRRKAEVKAGRLLRIWNVLMEWQWHIATLFFVAVVIALAPRQATLLIYKASLPMIGACGAYWLNKFFFYREPECKETHARWQLIALMCAGMLAMGLGA
jgi:hypothetical protein